MTRQAPRQLLGSRRFLLVVCALLIPAGASSSTVSAAPARVAPREDNAARARRLFGEGRTLFNLGRHAEALERFQQAYETLPLSGFLYNIAQCHRFLKNWKRAIYFYRGYLRDNPGAPNTDVVEGLIKRSEGKLAEAEQTRGRALAAFEEGRKAFRLADYRAALAHFRRAYQIQPLPAYLFHIAEAHRQLGEYDRAIALYEGYLKDQPGAPTERVQGHIKECREKLEARRRAARPRLVLGGGQNPLTGDPLPPPPPPIHRRWWFWTSVAAGVVALAVGLGVGLGTRDTSTGPNPPITPLGTVDWR